MRAERKQSKILNATLQHGNDMEAWSRQLKFMQFAYTMEVDLVVESDDEVELVKEPSKQHSI